MNAFPEFNLEACWKQIYTHLRSRYGCPHHEAEDLTQDLFTRVLEKGTVDELSQRFSDEDGRRNYLFACARNLFNDARRRVAAAKRGGGAIHLSIGTEDGQMEPASNTKDPSEETAQHELCADWQRELSNLALEATLQGKLALFKRVCGALVPGERSVDSLEVASVLGIKPGTVRVQMHRWRESLLENMRARLAEPIAA